MSKREFTGAIGTIRTILGAKNGVFTGALSDELGMETQWFEVGAYTRQSIRVFDYYITL